MSDVQFKAHIPTVQFGFLEVTSGNAYEIKKALDDPEFQEVFNRLAGRTSTPTVDNAEENVSAAAAAGPEVGPAEETAAPPDSVALTPLEKARQRMAQKKGA